MTAGDTKNAELPALIERRYSSRNWEVVMMVRNRKEAESGYVLVTVAVLLVVLVGFTTLAIDTGMLFAARTQAQRAADAAALAGASTFVLNSSDLTPAATARANA